MTDKQKRRPRVSRKNPLALQEKSLQELRVDAMSEAANSYVDILGNQLPKINPAFHYSITDADRVKNAFDFTFTLIGGQPQFALWAAQNPTEFYKLYSRMLPQQNNMIAANGPLTIITNVPDSPLDNAKPVIVDWESTPDNSDDE